MATTTTPTIRLIVFDWAGTTVDFGSMAPLQAFLELFRRHGVTATAAQARAPMGLHKRDHILAMLRMPDLAAAWQQAKGAAWTDADVDQLYHEFAPIQLEAIRQSSRLVPDAAETISQLRSRGLSIGATTGYFREAAGLVCEAATEQGYRPDCSVCADDVPAGRPAPWMIYRVMESLDIYPPLSVIKVGDTLPDIAAGLNAGCWSLGVTTTSSEVGLSQAELEQLSADQRQTRLHDARQRFLQAGAHAVIDTLTELPPLVEQINGWLADGRRP